VTGDPSLWTRPVTTSQMRPPTLDGVDALELAELIAFTADTLYWKAADTIRDDLAAHPRRWATRLHPTPGT
jgi:hypothetical protein